MAGRPLARVTVAFAVGIALSAWAMPLVWAALPALAVCTVLFALTRRPIWGVGAILLAFALLGSARLMTTARRAPDDVAQLAPTFVTVTGAVESDVERSREGGESRGRTAVFTLAAREVVWGGENRVLRVSGNIAVRVPVETPTNAEAERIPHYGDVIRVRGRLEIPRGPRNPGGFDYRGLLANRGVTALLTARRADDWEVTQAQGKSGNLWLRAAFGLRQGMIRQAKRELPPVKASALNGILLGARGDLPGTLNDAFETTGTAHILATAGLHVGLVVWLLRRLQQAMSLARRPVVVVTFLILALYAVMAGGRPSVVRAAIVAGVYLAGMLLEREANLPNALSVAALGLLLYNPRTLFEAGFQLSFATVITIAFLMPFAEKALQRLRKRVRGETWGARAARFTLVLMAACFFLAIAAQVGAAPLVAYYYNELSFVSILANTLVVPVIGAVIALGFPAVGLAAVHPLLSWPLAVLLSLLLTYVITVVKWCAALPWAVLYVPSPSPLLIAAYYAVLWGLAWKLRPGAQEESEAADLDLEGRQ